MKNFLRKAKNPYFWIGVNVVLLLMTVESFLSGEFSIKKTLIYGTIIILIIGLDSMNIEKEKEDK